VCFGVRADIDAGAALVVAGCVVGDVAVAHCWGWWAFDFLVEIGWAWLSWLGLG
jgi:hypothetical protein